jgi:hypothetical protein
MKTKVKKYTRSAIYHDIVDYIIKSWIILHDKLQATPEKDLIYYMR